ncbi:MAG: portal protein, partial [Phycisphaerae bacterium]|nr:portal protein [Phycisphaerae bacterium]
MQFFGFRINPSDVVSKAEESKKSFIAKVEQDGAVEISPALGGSYGTYVDLEGSAKNEANVINKYRSMSMQPECDSAIDDVVNEAIVLDENENAVDVNTDKLEQPDSIKTAITEEFKVIMKLLDFNNEGYDIFRRWYVDGRLYFH